MKPSLLAHVTRVGLLAVALTACGGAPDAGPPLQRGQGIYLLRLNAPACQPDRPELHLEVETNHGWERVLVEADPETDLVERARERLRAEPRATVQVLADLSGPTHRAPGEHRVRTLRVVAVDPPME